MNCKEITLESNYIYQGKILNLKKDKVQLPDGNTSYREIVEHNGGSSILCEMDGKILLVKQFRYAYQSEIWEIPAGKKEVGENPAVTAIRELEEEGGVKAQSVELLYRIYPTPGYTNEIIYIYKAVNPVKTEVRLDKGEFLTGHWLDKETIRNMIKNGEILDAKTLLALNTIL